MPASAESTRHYRATFEAYLLAVSELEREEALLGASDLGKALLSGGASVDEVLSLHQRVQAALARDWRARPARSAQASALRRLGEGCTTPLMMAVLLPLQDAEQLRLERRWRSEHDKLSAIFGQTRDLILVFDARGRIEYLNPAFERATGWSLAQAAREQSTIWPHEPPASQTQRHSMTQSRRDGTSFLASWSVSSIVADNGQLQSQVWIGQDVTRQRRIEEGMRENDKLRAVATLAAGVAHDFNNLLGSILGLSELCELEAVTGSRQARNLAGIQQASRKAGSLVGQLLSFARETAIDIQPVSLRQFLDGCQPLLAAGLPPSVTLSIETPTDSVVGIDVVQFEQVILNLVNNAAYAMRQAGGRVTLVADQHLETGFDSALTSGQKNGQPDCQTTSQTLARIRVIDHGEGIPADILPRIFDPFFSTKPVGQGTGLGLAAAHGIIEQHQGRIEVSSKLGEPTVFSILLPLAAIPTPPG